MIEIRNYIIGIIIFVFFIVGGLAMMGILYKDKASITGDESYTQFNKTFNKLDQVTDKVEGLQSSIEDAEPEQGLFGVLNSLISTAWNSLKLVFTSFGFMNGVFSGMYAIFGVPSWIPALIMLIVVVIIAFEIWRAIFQR